MSRRKRKRKGKGKIVVLSLIIVVSVLILVGLVKGTLGNGVKHVVVEKATEQIMEQAVQKAKEYISGALAAMLNLGKGRGPMNHAFALPEAYKKEAE